MKVFMDMKPGGGLCTVLATMFRFKSEQRWRKFDFQVGKVCNPPHAASLTARSRPPEPAPCGSVTNPYDTRMSDTCPLHFLDKED